MESAKEKAIREAYGEHWDKVKDFVSLNDGICRRERGEYEKLSEENDHFGTNHYHINYRPKSLQGIENNNGWNLTSEKLPTDLKCYVCLENGKIPIIAFYTKGHEVGFEDWDDYEEYDEVEERDGTLYLKPGWYEECEQQNSAYDTICFKRNITHWMSFPNLPIY